MEYFSKSGSGKLNIFPNQKEENLRNNNLNQKNLNPDAANPKEETSRAVNC